MPLANYPLFYDTEVIPPDTARTVNSRYRSLEKIFTIAEASKMGEITPEELKHLNPKVEIQDEYDEEEDDIVERKNTLVHLLPAGTGNLYLTIPPIEDVPRSMSLTEMDAMDRETWSGKLDFLLSVIGFAVDLSSVWRFPYLCFKNGGGSFLVPYFLMLTMAGIPLFYMELCLGQYNKKGAITTWGRICPLFKGIGYGVVLIAFYIDFFYNVVISWSVYFFFVSFSYSPPWATCNNSWNTENCRESEPLYMTFGNRSEICLVPNESRYSGNVLPSDEYFHRKILSVQGFKDILHPGEIKWELVLCLMIVYVICYFSMWKGIKMSGKVVWFTAVFPYVVLTALLIRGVTLPGAANGISYYLTPNFTKLKEGEVWFDAATQVFFSLGPGLGVLLAFASYNEFHNNVYYDALVTASINSFTSILAGFVIFAVLGYMSCKSGLPIDRVAEYGPGLVFIVYPEALSTMPGSSFWSVIFFLMLITLGLDSSFGGSESVITALSDEIPWVRKNREIFIAILFSVYMVVNLLMCTEGGVYFVEFLGAYAASHGLLLCVFFETVVVSWVYGLQRFVGDVNQMMGFEPGFYWRFCWAILGPAFLAFNLVYGIIGYRPLVYLDYEFPWWMNFLGWLMSLSSFAAIPIYAVYIMWRTPGTFMQRLRHCLRPWKEEVVARAEIHRSSNNSAAKLKISAANGPSMEKNSLL